MCDAYIELSTNRPLGFGGVGPIPGWTIREYCYEHELSGDVARHFRLVIRNVDAETLRRQSVELASKK
jgi:hypothetical protein